jgi:hypothetical protein
MKATMLDSRFSYAAFVASTERAELAGALETEITRRLRDSGDPEKESRQLVEELRALGHDLWSFDESTDFQIWCGDWVKPKHPYELILTFRYEKDEAASVSAVFQERGKGRPTTA